MYKAMSSTDNPNVGVDLCVSHYYLYTDFWVR